MKQNFKKIISIVIILIFLSAILIYAYFIHEENVILDFDQTKKQTINLSDGTTSTESVIVKNNTITIYYGGTYELTGSTSVYNLVIKSKDDVTVNLIFNDIKITTKDTPAIYIAEASKTIITLADETSNYLEDTSGIEETNATIFSNDDLVLTGNGTLEVKANYADAIASKDTLIIESGTYIITSKDDGIRGKDSVTINDGTFTITSEGDAIKSTNDENSELGYVEINNGTFEIISTLDAIQAESNVNIDNGTFTIETGGGSSNASTSSDWGNWNEDETDTTSSSAKAIKAANNITIKNGEFIIDSSDDSIHADNKVTISDGKFNITSGDDGIHADNTIVIDDGRINITKSYEGIESADIEINNGTISVNSSDDGINAGGGADSSSTSGRPGQDTTYSSSDNKLTINGGYLYVDSAGDGLDANGSIYINGGTVIVNGPTDSGNGTLDYDGEYIIKGGTVIAAGSSGMLQTPSTSSAIYTLSIVFSSSISSGLIHIEDDSGNEIITFDPSKTVQAFTITSSLLKNNETYKIYTGGSSSESEKNGVYEIGNYKGGTLYDEVTITSKVTSLGNSSTIGGMR